MVIDTFLLEKGLHAAYDIGFEEVIKIKDALLAPVFMGLESKAGEENYGFMGDIPAIQEWFGDKTSGIWRDYKYTVPNRRFYSAFDIAKTEIDDEQMGRLKLRINGMVAAVSTWKQELLIELLNASLTALAYDGQAIFASRAAPNDNLLNGTGVTEATIRADIVAARAAMRQFSTDAGKVLGLEMDTLIVSDIHEFVFTQAIGPTFTDAEGNVQSNPINKWIKNMIFLPGLTDTTDWIGCAAGFSALKPFIFQTREEPNPVLDDTLLKRAGKYTYSVEMRGNAGFSLPILAVRTVNG